MKIKYNSQHKSSSIKEIRFLILSKALCTQFSIKIIAKIIPKLEKNSIEN